MRLRYRFEFGYGDSATLALREARRQKKKGTFRLVAATIRTNADGARTLRRLGYSGQIV